MLRKILFNFINFEITRFKVFDLNYEAGAKKKCKFSSSHIYNPPPKKVNLVIDPQQPIKQCGWLKTEKLLSLPTDPPLHIGKK